MNEEEFRRLKAKRDEDQRLAHQKAEYEAEIYRRQTAEMVPYLLKKLGYRL